MSRCVGTRFFFDNTNRPPPPRNSHPQPPRHSVVLFFILILIYFLQVPMPRAALKDLANSRGLARASAEATMDGGDGHVDRATTVSKDCDEADGVVLWADWPFSCVRLRGQPATVRRAVSYKQRGIDGWMDGWISTQASAYETKNGRVWIVSYVHSGVVYTAPSFSGNNQANKIKQNQTNLQF